MLEAVEAFIAATEALLGLCAVWLERSKRKSTET